VPSIILYYTRSAQIAQYRMKPTPKIDFRKNLIQFLLLQSSWPNCYKSSSEGLMPNSFLLISLYHSQNT